MCNKTYHCQCPKCGRLFFWTFKEKLNLVINENGYIEWRCYSCEKKNIKKLKGE